MLSTFKMKSELDALRGPSYWKLNVSILDNIEIGIRNETFIQISMKLGGNIVNLVSKTL